MTLNNNTTNYKYNSYTYAKLYIIITNISKTLQLIIKIIFIIEIYISSKKKYYK